MAKRFTDTNKYKKPFIRGLQGPYKLLWDYLYHDCDHAGIWIVDFEIAQLYIGQDMPVNKDNALKYFNNGEVRIIEVGDGSRWFIKPFIDFQYGELNENNRVHNSVIQTLKKYNLTNYIMTHGSSFLGAIDKGKEKEKDIYKDQDKDKGKNKAENLSITKTGDSECKMILPTMEMVRSYCFERGNIIDPIAFYNHYVANGWMVGKNKMKDWKAAVRYWEIQKKDNTQLPRGAHPGQVIVSDKVNSETWKR